MQNLPVPFDRRVWLEATSLTRAGHAVSVICPKLKGYVQSYERLDGVDVYRYPAPIQGTGALSFALEIAAAFLWTALLSLRIQLVGRNHRERCADACPHLGSMRDDVHGAIGIDAQVDRRMQRSGVGRRTNRRGLRERVAGSPLCDASGLARQMEAAYRRLHDTC